MKSIVLFITVISAVACLWMGCQKETEEPNCIEGTWVNDQPCTFTTKYTFNSDGTGTVWTNGCPNDWPSSCTNGAEWGRQTNFNYTLTNSGLTLTFTAVYICDDLQQGGLFTITEGDYVCDGDIMTLGTSATETYLRQ